MEPGRIPEILLFTTMGMKSRKKIAIHPKLRANQVQLETNYQNIPGCPHAYMPPKNHNRYQIYI